MKINAEPETREGKIRTVINAFEKHPDMIDDTCLDMLYSIIVNYPDWSKAKERA